MTQQGNTVAGRILVVSAALSVVGSGLFLAGVIPIARSTSLIVGGVLLAVGIVDGLLGLKLMKREGR
jgi:hypothetical protein